MKVNRYTLTILLATMLLVNVGFGVIMPVLPYYAEHLGASATTLGLLSATYATLQFLFAPFWGQLSDRYGRKPILLVGLVGFSASFLVFGLANRLWMLFLARAIGGIISSAALPAGMAYVSDSTHPDSRAYGMGLMGAAGGIGVILGPALGGVLAEISIAVPFFFAAGLAFLLLVFGYFFVPETLDPEVQTHNRTHPLSPWSSFGRIATILSTPLAFLMVLGLLTSMGIAQLESTAALFAERRFNAGSAEMGMLFMAMGATSAASQLFLVARVIRKYGEERTIQFGLLSAALIFGLFGVVKTYAVAFTAGVVLGGVSAFIRPALNTLISRRAPHNQQGSVLGVTNSYYSLGMVFGPVTGGALFDHMGIIWPFLSTGIIHAVCFITTLRFFPRAARAHELALAAELSSIPVDDVAEKVASDL